MNWSPHHQCVPPPSCRDLARATSQLTRDEIQLQANIGVRTQDEKGEEGRGQWKASEETSCEDEAEWRLEVLVLNLLCPDPKEPSRTAALTQSPNGLLQQEEGFGDRKTQRWDGRAAFIHFIWTFLGHEWQSLQQKEILKLEAFWNLKKERGDFCASMWSGP